MTEDNTEVLILTCEIMVDGYFWRREVVFGSDHLVFTRVSQMADPCDGWDTHGWLPVPAHWQDLGELERVSERMKAKGWQVEWHPRYGPISREFFMEVRH